MGKYWQFLKMSFMELFEYRMNLVWEILGSALSISIIYAFWIAVLGSGFTGSNYTTKSIGLYYLIITLIDYITHFSFSDVSESIYNGFLQIEVNRPYNFQLKTLLISAGRRLTKSLIIVLFVITVVKFNNFYIPLQNISIFVLMIFLGSIIRFYIGMTIGTTAFWLNRVHGLHYLFWVIGDLFSGKFIPVDILPKMLLNIADWLPFPYLFFYPSQLLLHQNINNNVLQKILILLMWISIFWAVYKVTWKQGLKNIESRGG